jgi:hypothetical protein
MTEKGVFGLFTNPSMLMALVMGVSLKTENEE